MVSILNSVKNVQNMTLWPKMENMIFYDFITFVIDFVGVFFCLKFRFIASWSTEKNMNFMTLNGPNHKNSKKSLNIICLMIYDPYYPMLNSFALYITKY